MNPLYNSKTGMIATPTKDTTAVQQTNAVNQGFSSQITPVNPPSPIPADGLSTPAPNPIPSQTTAPVDLNISHGVGAPTGTTTDANGIATIPPPTPDKKKIMDTLYGLGEKIGLRPQATLDAQNEAQLSQKREQATKDYNTYNQKKLEYQQNLEAMHARSGGLTGGLNEEIDSYSRRANADLANLAIQAQSSQGLLDSAKATIKDKIDAQFQPIQDQIDFYTKFLQANNNDLTESEKFKLTEAQNTKKADMTTLTKTADDLHQNMLANNAPKSVYDSLDKITADYVAGKIAASDAQSKMYQTVGKHGISKQGTQTIDVAGHKLLINSTGDILKDFGSTTSSAVDIKEGSKEYKIAQDLAYGDLTFAQFKSLYSYSRDVNAKTSIYDLAASLNPNFSPAAFELGFKFAANPKVRQQVAALDNVQATIPKLMEESDAAARTNIPLLNKAIIKGGLLLGGKSYSNLDAARTAFADELSGALGFGSATDMSREMGFDLTRTDLSPAQFSEAINNVVIPFIAQKRQTLLNQFGVYGQTINNFSNPKATDVYSSVNASVDSLRTKYGY